MTKRLEVLDITAKQDISDEEKSADAYTVKQISPGKKVSLYFSLQLTDGEEIDSNFGKKPVTFVIGDGNMLPGFERAIWGLTAGEKRVVELAPENAFGGVNEDNIRRYPRTRFPAQMALEKGIMVAFAAEGNHEQTGVIVDFDDSGVKVDFNHPLAGRTIIFTVEVLAVEPAATDFGSGLINNNEDES